MEPSRRTRVIRALAALAAVAVAVGAAVALAELGSDDTLDAPSGGLPEETATVPLPPLDLVVDGPAGSSTPKGLVWVLCCGAWRSPSSYGIDLRDRRDRRALGALEWTRRGYAAASFAAKGVDTAVDEAVAAYDRLRAGHPDLEICAVGGSAAGHMALMVAARRPGLRCVDAHSAPTSLADLADEPIPGVLSTAPLTLAVEAFGRDRLDELSPIRHAGEIRGAVRLSACSADRIVPPAQARRMAAALRRAGTARVVLDVTPGTSVRRGRRPPRGTRHLTHECFATAERVAADRAARVRFVEGELGGS